MTAHDEHAVRAFDAEALDYLLKPFDRARFRKTLDRARLARRRDPEQLLADLRRLLEKAGPERRPLRRIAVRSQGRMHSHRVEEIHCFGAADNDVRIHTGRGVHAIRETLSEQAQHFRLPGRDTAPRQLARNVGPDAPPAGDGPARVPEKAPDVGALELGARGLVDVERFA